MDTRTIAILEPAEQSKALFTMLNEMNQSIVSLGSQLSMLRAEIAADRAARTTQLEDHAERIAKLELIAEDYRKFKARGQGVMWILGILWTIVIFGLGFYVNRGQ
jgi:predicted RNase H-like nuclease (RuvC/YqgF family)